MNNRLIMQNVLQDGRRIYLCIYDFQQGWIAGYIDLLLVFSKASDELYVQKIGRIADTYDL